MNESLRALTDEVMTLAESYQRDCHEIIGKMMEGHPRVSVQDATNVFIFNKLAEIQVQISRLNEKINLPQ